MIESTQTNRLKVTAVQGTTIHPKDLAKRVIETMRFYRVTHFVSPVRRSGIFDFGTI